MKTLPFSALKASLKQGYALKDLKADLFAGVVVGIVALPLAMALAIAVGVAPQYGLYTAIFAGFSVALFGGSKFQITGPTAAFVVILSPIFHKYGFGGLLLAGLMAGLFLVIMGLARLGKLIQFIPHPVTTGFTAGIGVVIAFLQLRDFLGLTMQSQPDHFIERVVVMIKAYQSAHLQEFIVGLATILLILYLPKIINKIPSPIIALSIMTALTYFVSKFYPEITFKTLGTQFNGIPGELPKFVLPWQMQDVSLGLLSELALPAFTIAMLGAIESLLSAVVADGLSGTKHNPDSELIAQGVGNIICPFFGGIPATGAIARTATNIRYGSRSPISAMVHSVVIFFSILILSKVLFYLPMAALAGLLIIVAWNMSDIKNVKHILGHAPRSDKIVFITCFLLTVVFDMVVAVCTGIVLASFLFMKRMSDTSSVSLISWDDAVDESQFKPPQGVILYEIAGPLFFGAAEKAMSAINNINEKTKVVVFNMRFVPTIDETGLLALESAVSKLHKKHIKVIFACLQKQPDKILDNSIVINRPGGTYFNSKIQQALEQAKALTAK
ncbi:MAG: C4-dicarboxylic acid transporter DauA [Oligoflexia bacterium]|nr:C4-dicarboxylic acid transporter DauA [Oligoflexia bacterium]